VEARAAVPSLKHRLIANRQKSIRNADGARLPGIRVQYERARNPKKLLILDGSAHGQLIFDTPHGEELLACALLVRL
jgi:hypothetical protein